MDMMKQFSGGAGGGGMADMMQCKIIFMFSTKKNLLNCFFLKKYKMKWNIAMMGGMGGAAGAASAGRGRGRGRRRR